MPSLPPAARAAAAAAAGDEGISTTSASAAEAAHAIKAALSALNQPTTAASADAPGKAALLAAAEAVKQHAARVGVVCSGAPPPESQLAGLASAMQGSCVAFVAACHAATAAAGPSLKTSLAQLAQGVANPCLMLVKEMASGKDLKPHVAAVWDGVAAVSKAPADNKACLFAALAKVMAVLKDTLRELEELLEEQQEQYGNEDDDDSSSSGDEAGADASGPQQQQQQQQQQDANGRSSSPPPADPDLDYEAEEMSSNELALLGASLVLLCAAAELLRAFGRALLQGPALAAGSEALEGWESTAWHAKHLRRAAEDLGAAMYPPQDLEEVASAALAVSEVGEMMVDEVEPDALGAPPLGEVAAQLAAAHQQLHQLLQVQQQQQQQEAAGGGAGGGSGD